jgi:hypothetical protein
VSSLILNAGTSSPIIIPCQRLGKAANRYVGNKTDSANGAERSSIRGQKRVIPVLASYVDTATEASIQAAIYNGVQIPCSGDILQNIQTLCSIECVSSDIVPGLVGFYVMQLALSEVNASTVLLKYAPGDTLTGEVFARSTLGTYFDVNLQVKSAAINTKRDSHYTGNGASRSILLEGGATNLVIRAEELDNAAWTKTNTTITANATTCPDGTNVAADKIVETAVNSTHSVTQSTTNGNAPYTGSCFFKAAERTRVVLSMSDNVTGNAAMGLDLSTGLTFSPGFAVGSWTNIVAKVDALGNSWYRLSVSATRGAGTVTILQILPDNGSTTSYLGDITKGLYAWGGQIETGPFATSYISTTSATVTRGADSYQVPFTTPPQEMSVYAKFGERGSVQTASAGVFAINAAGGAAPTFVGISTGSFYRSSHANPSTVTSTLGVAPAINDVTELDARLFADGSTDLTQSVNSAAATSATQSAAATPATAWSGQLVWLNSLGSSNPGFMALQSFKIVAGARSLTEMRAA